MAGEKRPESSASMTEPPAFSSIYICWYSASDGMAGNVLSLKTSAPSFFGWAFPFDPVREHSWSPSPPDLASSLDETHCLIIDAELHEAPCVLAVDKVSSLAGEPILQRDSPSSSVRFFPVSIHDGLGDVESKPPVIESTPQKRTRQRIPRSADGVAV